MSNPACTDVECRFNDRTIRVINGCRVNDVALEKSVASKKSKKQSPCSKIKTAFDLRHGKRILFDEKSFFDELSVIESNACDLMSPPANTGWLTPSALKKIAEVILSGDNGVPYQTLDEI